MKSFSDGTKYDETLSIVDPVNIKLANISFLKKLVMMRVELETIESNIKNELIKIIDNLIQFYKYERN